MMDSTVENMDDEELLMYYETTRKFLESRMKDEKSSKWKSRDSTAKTCKH